MTDQSNNPGGGAPANVIELPRVDPPGVPLSPQSLQTPAQAPEAPRREPVQLHGAPIEKFAAALAWAARLGHEDARTNVPERNSRHVMETYPFIGQTTHEQAVHEAYKRGRWHFGFSSNYQPAAQPFTPTPGGKAVNASREAPRAPEAQIVAQPHVAPHAAGVPPPTEMEIKNTSLPYAGKVQKVTS
jgi:hypothetical protein